MSKFDLMKWLQLGREKKESITAGSTAFGFKVGKLLLKAYCWKKQMGTRNKGTSLKSHRN